MKLLNLMGRGDAAKLMTAVKMGERSRGRRPVMPAVKGIMDTGCAVRSGSCAMAGARA